MGNFSVQRRYDAWSKMVALRELDTSRFDPEAIHRRLSPEVQPATIIQNLITATKERLLKDGTNTLNGPYMRSEMDLIHTEPWWGYHYTVLTIATFEYFKVDCHGDRQKLIEETDKADPTGIVIAFERIKFGILPGQHRKDYFNFALPRDAMVVTPQTILNICPNLELRKNGQYYLGNETVSSILGKAFYHMQVGKVVQSERDSSPISSGPLPSVFARLGFHR